MKTLLLLSLAFFCTFLASAQTQVDSLLRLCENTSGIKKTDIYLQLTKITIQDSAKSNAYNKKAFQLAIANNQLPEQAKSVYYSARICYTSREFTDAIRYYQKALELYRQLNDTTGMRTCYRYIGISNFNMSKSKEAIASYLEGLKLAKKDLDYTAELLGNIGLVHNEMDNIKDAIRYFRQALSINQSIRDTISMAVDYDYLGATYSRMKMPDSSLINYHKALFFFKKIKKDDRYAVSLSNMAWILPNYPDSLNKAISYFNSAWEKFKELGWVHYEPNIQFGIANILSKQGKFEESISAYKKSIQLATQFKRELFLKKQLYQGLGEVYQKKGDYKHALDYHILASQYNDSVVEKQKSEHIANLEKQYETEKKENEIIRLNARHELTNIQLTKNKQLKLLGFLAASLLLVLVFYILKKYAEKRESNEILEKKNMQIEKSEQELRILNASKNKFFSIIAHDLKSPFNTILGFSNLLLNEIKKNNLEGIEEYAEIIMQSSKRASSLLMNLMEWAQSQTGRMEYHPETLKILDVVDENIKLYLPIASKKGIKIDTSIPNDVSLFVDNAMIHTVFRNLISNAIKFTNPGGLITISTCSSENYVTVSVKDTGIGIPKNNLEKIFLIDSKHSTLGTEKEKGTGLGLILCKEFVEKNLGKIWAESIEGLGSTIYFTLPVKAN